MRYAITSCALRDTFFGHPVSICTGPSETLAHRAQVHGSGRNCLDTFDKHPVRQQESVRREAYTRAQVRTRAPIQARIDDFH